MDLGGNNARDQFPPGFRAQHIRVAPAVAVCQLPPPEIAQYFRDNIDVAQALLTESYDKRYEPSSFISEETGGFSVGWYSRQSGSQCVKRFSDLADAATDYLLFSLGRGRWTPPTSAASN
jgi:hypothetical protein